MAKSNIKFNRWGSREPSTWPFQVFRKYNLELDRIYWSQVAASKFTYKNSCASGINWTHPIETHFDVPTERAKMFRDLEDWSETFDSFANWVRLNCVIAVACNLETYMAAVIRLAVESDPGVLSGATRTIDGARKLKCGEEIKWKGRVQKCTEGGWTSRNEAYEKLFGTIPPFLKQKTSELDNMRNLRNRIGHAFGRDIDLARKHGVRQIIPMETLTQAQMQLYQRTAYSSARAIDRHLIKSHIGEYQILHFYHSLVPKLNMSSHPSVRAMALKRAVGQFQAMSPGKRFCKGLVSFYDSL